MTSIRRRSKMIATSVVVALGLGSSGTALATWLQPVSEENGGPAALCPATFQAVNGFDSTGDWSDNLQLRCATLPYGITVSGYNNSDFFSEEDSGVESSTSIGWHPHDTDSSHVCNFSGAAGVMTGVRCSGQYCDNVSVECALPVTTFEGVVAPVDLVDCEWLGPFSEEDPPLTLPYGRFITGVDCEGSYCDNMSFFVCRMQGPVSSCMGRCGGPSRGACFCDAACEGFDDCCSDFEAACIP